jgi:hypothetical protein
MARAEAAISHAAGMLAISQPREGKVHSARGNSDDGESPGGAEGLSFSSTVPRELVHRRAIAEVFMTDLRRIGEGRYIAAAQWPRLHDFYHSGPGAYDTALIAETLRQATILVAHVMEGVALGQVFLMPAIAVRALEGPTIDPGTPTEVHLRLDVKVSQRNIRGPAALQVEARFSVGGRPIASGSAGARLVDPVSYARMRLGSGTDQRCRQTTALPPDRVGHRVSRNVVIGEACGGLAWPLHVDLTNPTLFDHPVDHVPGLLMVEGFRQVLRVQSGSPGLDFQTFDASFLKIVELDDDALVVLRSVDLADQHGGTAQGTITVRGAVCVELSCSFKLNALKRPRPDSPREQSGGQVPGTHHAWLPEPLPATGSTTFPQSSAAHQHGG